MCADLASARHFYAVREGSRDAMPYAGCGDQVFEVTFAPIGRKISNLALDTSIVSVRFIDGAAANRDWRRAWGSSVSTS